METGSPAVNVTDLLPGTDYTFRVVAVSVFDDVQALSPPSPPFMATTDPTGRMFVIPQRACAGGLRYLFCGVCLSVCLIALYSINILCFYSPSKVCTVGFSRFLTRGFSEKPFVRVRKSQYAIKQLLIVTVFGYFAHCGCLCRYLKDKHWVSECILAYFEHHGGCYSIICLPRLRLALLQ